MAKNKKEKEEGSSQESAEPKEVSDVSDALKRMAMSIEGQEPSPDKEHEENEYENLTIGELRDLLSSYNEHVRRAKLDVDIAARFSDSGSGEMKDAKRELARLKKLRLIIEETLNRKEKDNRKQK
ncbi:MAG: hypothetical protein NTW11_00085 [Candidatus Staskawiczbacteria bacterium]|nr:hypothetical protein [Candidatus Staskawiczbacteria bacterium]